MNHTMTDMLTINSDMVLSCTKGQRKWYNGSSQKTKNVNFSAYIHTSVGLNTLTHVLDNYIIQSTTIFQFYRSKSKTQLDWY